MITVRSPGMLSGTVGRALPSTAVPASDSGRSILRWTATNLPAGLSLNSATGVITGTPTKAGSGAATVAVADSTGAVGAITFSWTIADASTAADCGWQRLVNPSLEGDARGWRTSADVSITDKRWAHSGAGFAWLDGYGTAHTDTLSQAILLPAHCHASFTFWLWTTTDDDTGRIHDTLQMTVNGQLVASYSNRNASSGYQRHTLDLSHYAGRRIALTITGRENPSIVTSFLLDDLSITIH